MIINREIKIEIDENARFILEKLAGAGFEAYVVGGAIRDAILGRTIYDSDIATSCLPIEVKRLFGDFKVIETGIKHGTVTVIIDKKPYEITTFRSDGDYADNRHPSCVDFSASLVSDAARRDFTINSLYYNPNIGLIDCYNGLADIKNGIIKAVGDADVRFQEDALRILRAVRFASKLGFKIEEKTAQAMQNNRRLLGKISVERIYNELIGTLCGDNVFSALNDSSDILFEIIPELKATFDFDQKSLSHSYTVFEHTLKVVEGCNKNDVVLRLTALFHDSGKPTSFTTDKKGFRHYQNHWLKSSEIAKNVLTRLKAPKAIINEVAELCIYHDEQIGTKYEIKKLLGKFGTKFFDRLLKHKYSDLMAHTEHGINKYRPFYDITKKLYEEIISFNECYTLKQLKVKGDDILKLNLKSMTVSNALDVLLDLVMQEKLPNDKEELINYACRNFA